MQGNKTHEQQLRILERKPDVPDARQMDLAQHRNPGDDRTHVARNGMRQSEFPVSRGGMNQESDHNKHNDRGQINHKLQQPGPDQQKQ
ncbi:MAG TPA: hypothetical protein VFQ87_20165 [Bradyrhizobium sp.]|jgi:hypothetical protein|nr:hypothetical protein [Bradyrhizobium sp.]